MRITRNLEFQIGSKEEKLPYSTADFPYVASRAELDYYRESFVPWHWHNAVELFYIESGELKYYTPNKKRWDYTAIRKSDKRKRSHKTSYVIPNLFPGFTIYKHLKQVQEYDFSYF